MRELVVLGTASQVPTRYRNHNGYLLRWDDEAFLFDPGEGTQRQMTYAGVPATAITRVCITHFHGDHCLGLAGISQRISLDQTPHVVHAYYPASGQVYFERLRHASIYHDVGRWEAHPIEAAGELARTPTWTLRCARLDHDVETFGYRLEEADGRTLVPARLAAAGVRGAAIAQLQAAGTLAVGDRTVTLDEVSVPRRGQVVAFVMDTRACDAAIELARDADVLICESTYLAADADKARAHGHLTATEAATIAREAGVRQLVLAHFSQRYADTDAFVAEAAAVFPAVVAARDLDRIPVPKRAKHE